jgi:hypothetical protein
VKHIGTPGVEIRRLFGLVRDDVLSSTARQQEPFIYGSCWRGRILLQGCDGSAPGQGLGFRRCPEP